MGLQGSGLEKERPPCQFCCLPEIDKPKFLHHVERSTEVNFQLDRGFYLPLLTFDWQSPCCINIWQRHAMRYSLLWLKTSKSQESSSTRLTFRSVSLISRALATSEWAATAVGSSLAVASCTWASHCISGNREGLLGDAGILPHNVAANDQTGQPKKIE